MKTVTVAQMRELDRRTIEEAGISGEKLMERAGQGVADAVHRLAEASGYTHPVVHLVAGRGNNGGDAFAAARILKEDGMAVMVWLAGSVSDIQGDAHVHMSRLKAARIHVDEFPTLEDWEEAKAHPAGADILVDGILGTGSTGPARGPAAGAIQYINGQARYALIVSIDLPSGLNGDTGTAEGDAVRADVTITMGLPKRGLLEPAALEYVGTLEVADIGLRDEQVAEIAAEEPQFIYFPELKALYPPRLRNTHKGTYGHVLLVGGAPGYTGAITLAARAAYRSGAGLVTVLTPQSVAPLVAAGCLEAMVQAGPETETGSLHESLWSEWRQRVEKFDAILVGPGLTRHPMGMALVRHFIRECNKPLVLDADALGLLEGQVHLISKTRHPAVITPHPGEMAGLLASTKEAVQGDRMAALRKAVVETNATVILKGAGTLVGHPGKPIHVNLTGNPGMATGGTGDVLAGMVTGLLGQGLFSFDAARLAVYAHGRAGDLVAARKTQAGIMASDLVEEIPYAFHTVTIR